MAAKKTVLVTSVTPNIKTTPVPAAQQKRTRDLVVGIATALPLGRAAREVAGIKGAGGKMVNALYKDSGGHVNVKPAAKPIANPPDAARIRNKYWSSVNRIIDTEVPSGARASMDAGRKNRIQANKLKSK